MKLVILRRTILEDAPKCPFCGAKAELREHPNVYGFLGTTRTYSVACSAEASECYVTPSTRTYYSDPEMATYYWSERAEAER